MKPCAYCGAENEDAVQYCRECGGEEFRDPAAISSTPDGPDLVTVCTCPTVPEADIVVGRLEAAGISAFVPDQVLLLGGASGSFGRVRIQVAPTDYEAAKELLSSVGPPA